MEKNNTREEILEAALDLFSVNGYEATSISQLSDAVGVRKASLYSHFANKQDILDTVVETVLKGYADHSIFVRANWDDAEFTKDKTGMKAEDVVKLIQAQMRYILHDPHISKGRKMDCLGNPVEIGIAVMWRVTDTAKAVFNVDNYKEYLSLQCDSALRNIVRLYPYDVAPNVDTTGDGVADDGSLRGSSDIVAERIRTEIQQKVENAGLEILEARITYLAYAPEIAAVMLQRQQASAIIDARKMIVDGAVGMVEMALERLNENHTVDLDEERKAAMVSNLLVVLCGNHDAQPIVNTGSLY